MPNIQETFSAKPTDSLNTKVVLPVWPKVVQCSTQPRSWSTRPSHHNGATHGSMQRTQPRRPRFWRRLSANIQFFSQSRREVLQTKINWPLSWKSRWLMFHPNTTLTVDWESGKNVMGLTNPLLDSNVCVCVCACVISNTWQITSLFVKRTISLYLGVLYLFLSWKVSRLRA